MRSIVHLRCLKCDKDVRRELTSAEAVRWAYRLSLCKACVTDVMDSFEERPLNLDRLIL